MLSCKWTLKDSLRTQNKGSRKDLINVFWIAFDSSLAYSNDLLGRNEMNIAITSLRDADWMTVLFPQACSLSPVFCWFKMQNSWLHVMETLFRCMVTITASLRTLHSLAPSLLPICSKQTVSTGYYNQHPQSSSDWTTGASSQFWEDPRVCLYMQHRGHLFE